MPMALIRRGAGSCRVIASISSVDALTLRRWTATIELPGARPERASSTALRSDRAIAWRS
jgi:hypothetical protein